MEAVARLHPSAPNRLWLTTNHGRNPHAFDEMVELCKAVGGARFLPRDQGGPAWTYPLTVDTCLALRRTWGKNLRVGKDVAEWFVQANAGAVEHTARAAATDAELRYLPARAPALAATLRPDQRVGVAWAAEGYRGAGLIADVPGAGKTLETIGAILEREDPSGPHLVVCPRISVRRVWGREWRKWAPDAHVYEAIGTRAQREAAIAAFMEDFTQNPEQVTVLIIVMEMLRVKGTRVRKTKKPTSIEGYEYPEIFNVQWATIAVDESHRGFGSLTIANATLAGEGLRRLRDHVRPGGRRYAVTGTPFGRGGKIHGMFGTLHWLWPDEHTSFWQWAERYFDVEDDEIVARGGVRRTVKRIAGLRGGQDGEAFMKGLGPRILRRTKEEILPWLPPKQYVEVMCEMEGEQLRQYKTFGKEAEVNSTSGGYIAATGVLAQIVRAKQFADGALRVDGEGRIRFTGESGKIDVLMQMLAERGITGEEDDPSGVKLIVASQFNEFLYAIQERLDHAGIRYYLVTGKTSDRKRDEHMDAFQAEGGPRVFLLNSKTGGLSITLDAADEVHVLDEMWNPEDNEQLEDRAHRASRNHQVTIYYYRSEGTIDETIADDVEGKRFNQFLVLDGRRGLQYVRDLVQYRSPKRAGAA